MDAEYSGYVARNRFAHGGDGCVHGRGIVADQGGQQSGGAEATVRGGDARDAVDRRRIVEQHAAAAVDLAVDETGRKRATVEIDDLCRAHARVGGDDDIGDVRAIEQHGGAVDETGIAKHARVDQCGEHQTVSVTLRKCGGTSGFRPRRSESALAAR